MTWLPKLLLPFISPEQLRMELDGVRSLDRFFNLGKSIALFKKAKTV